MEEVISAPSGMARTSSSTQRFDPAGVEDLKVTARTILWNCGIDYGPSKIHRLCCQFVNRVQGNGFSFFDFIANRVELSVDERRRALANPEIQRVFAYPDPVGEEAVNNVLRERGF